MAHFAVSNISLLRPAIIRCVLAVAIAASAGAAALADDAGADLSSHITSPVAADALKGPATVSSVNIKGLKPAEIAEARPFIATRSGSVFSEQVAKSDQRRLINSGLYDDVAVFTSRNADGTLNVTFVMSRRFAIEAIKFNGNRHHDDKKLRGEISATAGTALDHSQIAAGQKAITALYKKSGYYFVDVTYEAKALENDRELIYKIVEGPRLRVRSVKFDFLNGNGSFVDILLASKVQTGTGLWAIIPGRLDDDKLSRDIEILRSFYRSKGFLDAEVSVRKDFSSDRKKADISFVIDEGPRYRVASVRFNGNDLYSSGELLTRLKMTRGDNHDADQLQSDTKAIKTAYGRLGFINATVKVRTVFLDPAQPAPADLDNGKNKAYIALVYDIKEGQQYKLGRIEIRGNRTTKDRVIRRDIYMRSDAIFDSAAMELGQENLRRCGLFAKANITPFGQGSDVRDALVSIEEGHTSLISLGVSASSESGFGGTFRYRQSNFSWTRTPTSFKDAFLGNGFKGDGQVLQMVIEPGTKINRGKISWSEPRLMDGPYSLNIGAYTVTRDTDNYQVESHGGNVSLGRSLGGLWYGELNTGVECFDLGEFDDDTPSEFDDEQDNNLLFSGGATLVRNSTDNRWLPGKGGKLTLSGTQYTGDFDFTKTKAEYVHYWTAYTDALDRKHVLAIKGSSEFIFGDAPNTKKYYGGGMWHVRGFEGHGISPRTQDKKSDEPVGGDFKAYLGAEYSIPLVAEVLRGVLFIDSGTVEKDFHIETWRVSAGFGFNISMGDIPIKLNFGFPIVEDETDDREMLSFSLGWIF